MQYSGWESICLQNKISYQAMTPSIEIRNATPAEYADIGKLMVHAYSNLSGFLKPDEHPAYYNLLENIGEITKKTGTELLAAVSSQNVILGAVVYFDDMQQYGSGGTATRENNSSGFRFLAVADEARGNGIGKLLTQACLSKAKDHDRKQVIIHTTMAMQTAWKMYEQIGFKRSEDLDFMQGELKVFGFRYSLK
jgi:GNAT superfamily N-acetyltransferase